MGNKSMKKMNQMNYSKAKKIAPCKGCQDRYLGCHSECEKYKEYEEYKKGQEAVVDGSSGWSYTRSKRR